MKNSALHLIRYAKAQGNVVSVYDGGDWAIKKSDNEREIMDAMNSVDEAQIIVRDKEGNKMGWALIVNGLDPEELVADHSDNDWFQAWNDRYKQDN